MSWYRANAMQAEMIDIIRQAESLEETLTRDLNKFTKHPDAAVGAWFIQMVKARNHIRNAAQYSSDAIRALE